MWNNTFDPTSYVRCCYHIWMYGTRIIRALKPFFFPILAHFGTVNRHLFIGTTSQGSYLTELVKYTCKARVGKFDIFETINQYLVSVLTLYINIIQKAQLTVSNICLLPSCWSFTRNDTSQFSPKDCFLINKYWAKSVSENSLLTQNCTKAYIN